jgi:glucose/arabinose dehydrogenase
VEDIRFPLNDTPFGFDWERGLWPEPYRHGLFVALHGSYYTADSYHNAGLVYVPTDPATGRPRGTAPIRFLEGLGVARGLGMPNTVATQRPADVAFASDGRLFFSVDQGNAVYWLAPTTLRRPLRAR